MDVDSSFPTSKETVEPLSEKVEPESVEEMPEKVELPSSIEKLDSHHAVLCTEMLDHLANSKVAFFKSQQVGDPELNFEEKREIAANMLNKSPSQFLARFGQHILESHLECFSDESMKTEYYEIEFHVGQLRRFHCKEKHQVDIKNRRFEALKKLVDEGAYFSESEMMKRNPLLYDQLVGQYLTEEEVEEREREIRAESERSYLCHLLQRIEEHEVNLLRKRQQDDEDGAVEEVDTSDEDEDDRESCNEMNGTGAEEEEDSEDDVTSRASDEPPIGRKKLMSKERRTLSSKERSLLREEFVTIMYQRFLDGKETDFDYSEVDRNPDFECLAVRTQDEEEKYFDSETPELVSSKQGSEGEEDEGEDELDKFMKNLKPEATPSELADDMKQL